MKHTASSYVKLTLASMLVLLASCACAWRLMKIQIVESDTYTAKRVSTQEYTHPGRKRRRMGHFPADLGYTAIHLYR